VEVGETVSARPANSRDGELHRTFGAAQVQTVSLHLRPPFESSASAERRTPALGSLTLGMRQGQKKAMFLIGCDAWVTWRY